MLSAFTLARKIVPFDVHRRIKELESPVRGITLGSFMNEKHVSAHSVCIQSFFRGILSTPLQITRTHDHWKIFVRSIRSDFKYEYDVYFESPRAGQVSSACSRFLSFARSNVGVVSFILLRFKLSLSERKKNRKHRKRKQEVSILRYRSILFSQS